jgi:hypothetical protein
MTTSEILEQIIGQYGQRHQIDETQALLILNEVQRMAMDEDLDAFVDYDTFLTADSDEGPYDFPTEPPCRKFVGLTKLNKSQLLGYTNYANPTDALEVSDYGMTHSTLIDRRKTFLPVQVNMLDRSFTLLFDPDTDSDVYRQVYYRKPKPIRNANDDGRLIVPEEYHYSLYVMASLQLADYFTSGQEAPRQLLNKYFRPWWDSLKGATDPNGMDYIAQGQVGP